MLEWLLSSPATKHRTALLHYILHQLCGYAFSRKDAICLEAKPIKTRLQQANKAQRTSVLNGTALSSFLLKPHQPRAILVTTKKEAKASSKYTCKACKAVSLHKTVVMTLSRATTAPPLAFNTHLYTSMQVVVNKKGRASAVSANKVCL